MGGGSRSELERSGIFASGPQRALRAAWLPGTAHERSEIERRPVHLEAALTTHQTKSERVQHASGPRLSVLGGCKEPPQKAGHIHIEERLGPPGHARHHR